MRRIQDEFKKLILAALVLSTTPAFGQAVVGKINRIGDATHLEFKGRKNWNYDVNKQKDGKIQVVVPAFDELTEVNLRTWVGPYIKSVKIDKSGPDNRYIVNFELTGNDVEVFDYLTDDPSRLIMDFYRQAKPKAKKPTKTAATELPEKKVPGKKVAKSKKKNLKYGSRYKKVDRNPAGGELIDDTGAKEKFVAAEDQYPRRGIFDAGDPEYKRFKLKNYQINEDAIIASKQNIYLKFPLLHVPFKRFTEVYNDKPEYEINPKDSKQNEEARLILTLYKRKRYGAFMKVYNYYVDKYKETPYDEIVHNLAAEMHIDRYLETKDPVDLNRFQSLYKMLNERFSQSQLLERNRLLLAYSALMSKQTADALQLLQLFRRQYPKSKESDYINLAIAEAFVLLNKPKDASKVLASLEKKHLDKTRGIEAAYRMGDVSAIFENYKEAQKRYARAMKTYPEFKKLFPNASHNLAESEFWTQDYKKSLDSFVEFLRIFPQHEHGGYAITRIGELLEILGADKSQVMGAFVEGYFRYPNNPGAGVARIRMLSQGLRGMKEKEKGLAIKEIRQIEEDSPLNRMDEFASLMISEGLSKRGEYREALDGLLTYFQDNPTKANMDVFKGRILRNISSVLKTETDNKNFMEALNFYSNYNTTWLKNADRVDTDYFKSLAYEQAGVFDEAAKGYDRISKKLGKIAGTKEEKKRKVYEHLPAKDEVVLRKAAVALEQKNYQKAYRSLASIKSKLPGEQEVEKVKIGADVAIATGDNAQAIIYLKRLVDGWKGVPELLAGPYLKLGQLYLGLKKYEEADRAITYIENMKANEKVSDDVWADALELKANYQVARGQKLAAVQTYIKLLDEFENQRPLESIRYKAGLLLFEEGDSRGAERLWSALKSEPSDFYKKLANEKLSQLEWDESYKKYLNRIPAAQ